MSEQKQIKDYLKYYIGQKCLINTAKLENKVDTITYLNEHGECGGHEYEWNGKDCQLILRPLSSMTEEEMRGLLVAMVPQDMEDKPTRHDYDVELFHNDNGLQVDSDVAIGAEYTCRCYVGQIAIRENGDIDLFGEDGEKEKVVNYPQCFHYLLSKGFDLFGLIESGLAVPENEKK